MSVYFCLKAGMGSVVVVVVVGVCEGGGRGLAAYLKFSNQ